MSNRSGRDYYHRSRGRDHVPPSHSHRSRSCDPRPRAYPRPSNHADQSNSSQSNKRHLSLDQQHHRQHPNNGRFDQPYHHHGSGRGNGLEDIHHENNVTKGARYPLSQHSKSNEAKYQAPSKRSKHDNVSRVDKENRLNTYHGFNHEQRSRLHRSSKSSYKPHHCPLASRQDFSSRTHLQQQSKVPHFGSISTIPDMIWTA